MLFPPGFYNVKKPKRFVIFYFNQKFSVQPLTFFWHNKTPKERVFTKSSYQIPPLVHSYWMPSYVVTWYIRWQSLANVCNAIWYFWPYANCKKTPSNVRVKAADVVVQAAALHYKPIFLWTKLLANATFDLTQTVRKPQLTKVKDSDAASRWAEWALLTHLEFGSSVNLITTRGADCAHHITASPPGFENPEASLHQPNPWYNYKQMMLRNYLCRIRC